MERAILELLQGCALFRGCKKSRIAELLEASCARRVSFSSGDELSCEERGKGRIGILLSGKLTVFSHGEERTPLNCLKSGGLFGVSALFGSPGAGTRILASSDGEVLFIGEDQAETLWEDRDVRRNLVSFLTDRICFLNRKIASFTASGAEGKLARHLSQNADEHGRYRVEGSFSQLAKTLHLGRASLYRAMEKLEQEGIISKEKKELRILSPESIELFW